jgi:GTPase SAR1 family protein
VSSTELNQTDGEVALEIPKRLLPVNEQQQGLSLSIVDIPGHFNFRLKVQQYMERAKGVILVVDSRDKDKISEAAEFLYDILSNNRLVKQRVPILVACNKQDLNLAKRAVQIEREFSTEFDAIRKVRKASREQENETTGGGIGTVTDDALTTVDQTIFDDLKGKFSFEQIPQASVTFIDCSVQQAEVDDVYRFLVSKFA